MKSTESRPSAGAGRQLQARPDDPQCPVGVAKRRPVVYQVQLCMPLVYERLGQRAAAEVALAGAIAAQREFSSYQYAQIYAQWGDTKKALDWLETALRIRDVGLEYLKTDPFLDPLRSQLRFQAIERQLKFPD
jgi:tetratricopeptide (TPR) repeat protein